MKAGGTGSAVAMTGDRIATAGGGGAGGWTKMDGGAAGAASTAGFTEGM